METTLFIAFLFASFFCSCVYASSLIYMYMYWLSCTWKSEVNTHVFPQISPTFLRSGHFVWNSLMKWDWLVNEFEGSAYTPAPLLELETHVTKPGFLKMILGMGLRFSCLQEKHFTIRAIFPTLWMPYSKDMHLNMH